MSKLLKTLLKAGVLPLALLLAPAGHGAARVIRAQNMTVAPGGTNRLYVALESLGDENAVGFSICFNTNFLTFISASRGAAALSAPQYIPNTNASQATNGRVGVLIGLAPPSTFSAGTNLLWEILFRAGPSAGVTTVSLCDTPVSRGVVDGTDEVNELPTSYANATVSVQDPFACSYSISPTSRSHGNGAATNTVEITAGNGCGWTISNLNAWITFPAGTNGSGNSTNTYIVEANPNLVSRTGNVMVAGQLLKITQDPAECSYQLSPSKRTHGAGANSNSFVVTTTPTNCNWTATTTNTWLTLVSGTNGPGSNTVGYLIAANFNSVPRYGAIFVGNQAFTITNSAAECEADLSPTSHSHGFGVETGLVSVAIPGGCPWTVVNTNSWIIINSGGSGGNGSGTVGYTVLSNSVFAARSGVVTIASNNFTITQGPAQCPATISPTNATYSPAAATGTVSVAIAAGCVWSVNNPNTWITIPSGGTGPGNINYTIATNSGSASRTGTVTIAGRVLTLIQSNGLCSIKLSVTNRNHGNGAANNSFNVTNAAIDCDWVVINTNSWITLISVTHGPGNATVNYSITANQTPVSRTGALVVNDQALVLIQAAGTCTLDISPATRSHGFAAATNTVTVTNKTATVGCPWTISNLNAWIIFPAGTNGTGTTTNTYYVLANTDPIPRTGVVIIANNTLTISQDGAAGGCVITLSPTKRTHGSGGTLSDNLEVRAPEGCPWTASTTNSWLGFVGATSGSGTNTVNYSVQPNPNPVERVGSLLIGGQTFVITQQALVCSYTISPTKRTHGSGGTLSDDLEVRAPEICPWTASTTNSWLGFVGATSGSGTNTVSYSVQPNPDPVERVGSLLVGGQTFVITQQALVCSYTISPTNRNHGFGAATNTISVTPNGSGCAWNAITTNNWITLSGVTNGLGSNTFTYVLAPNADSIGRTGLVFIANRFATISQDGVAGGCAITLSPTKRTHGSGGTLSDDVEVRAPEGCPWTASTTNSWLGFVGATSGSGTNMVNYSVQPNPDPVERVGSLLIGGQTFVITQQALVCSYTISPTNRNHGFGAATNTISVAPNSTSCAWNATTTNAWITLSGPTNGPGSNTFTYVLAPNADSIGRTGLVFIANHFVTISQSNAPGCSYVLSPTRRTHGPGGTLSDDLEVRAPEGCLWTASTTNSWLGFVGATSGSGTNTVNYSVQPNPNPVERVGSLLIGGQTFVITQQALVCSITLSPTNRPHGHGAATSTIDVRANGAGCPWNATTTNNWITLINTNGLGSNSVTYVLAANPTIIGRTGAVMIAGEIFTVSQSAAPCSYDISPESRTHGHGRTTNDVTLETLAGCSWTFTNANSWITISQTNALGGTNIIFTYIVEANPFTQWRTGEVAIATEVFTIIQQPLPCEFVFSPPSAAHGTAAGSGAFSVTTSASCSWTPTTTDSWITITTGSGMGVGEVKYTFPENLGGARVGQIIVGGQAFQVTQQGPCTFLLASNTAAYGPGPQSGSVTVTASSADCVWTVSESVSWITIQSAANNTNSGVVSYSVQTNDTAITRVGVVTIAGQSFTVTQTGTTCSYQLSSTSANYGPAATNGSVTVTTPLGCTWAASSGAAWISVTANTNTGIASYTVQTNNTANTRVGVLTIAGQSFTVTQTGTTCSYQLSSTSANYGPAATNGSVTVTTPLGCTWAASSGVAWISVTANTNTGIASYSVQTNNTAITRVGVLTIAGQSFTVTQTGTTCSYQLSSTSANYGAAATNGTVSVATPLGCTWAASSGAAWISVTANTNTGIASYTVQTNDTANTRIGVLTIAGQSFTVTQTGTSCSYQLSATSASYGAAATNGTVSVTTQLGCTWAASSGAAWISVTANTNTGIASYTVQTNDTANTRVGVLTIAGQSFTVTQSGTTCSYQLSATSASYGAAATNGTVSVTTQLGCTWAASSGAAWISVTANTNTGIASYSVQTNNTAITRVGVLTIAGQSFTVTQTGTTCSYQLSSTSANYGAAATNGSVTVTTLLGCTWAASSGAAWISVTANTNTGIASYTVQTNDTVNTRIGVLTIAGQSFTVTQTGTSCSYQLSATSANYGRAATNGTVSVTTQLGCTWGASSGVAWISVTANTNTGIASYTVQTNDTANARIGVLTIAGQSFTVTQMGAPCSVALSWSNWVHGAFSEPGLVGVISVASCGWAATTADTWITITSGTGTGNGHVGYAVAENTASVSRTGVVNIADAAFTVTQMGTGCAYSIVPTNRFHGNGANANIITVTADAGCAWNVLNTNSWITVLSNAVGTGSKVVGYSIAQNTSANPRAGVINIAGEILFITQWGTSCGFALQPNNRAHGFGPETNSFVTKASSSSCSWNISNTNSWIIITSGSSGTGDRTNTYRILTNASTVARTGVFTISGVPFTVNQAGAGCSFALSSPSGSHGANSATGSVVVTTGANCVWTVVNTNSWIAITSGLSRTNSGTVFYTVDPNLVPFPRTGIVSIAGQNFTVSQAAAACSFLLASNAAAHGSGPGVGAVAVTTSLPGCTWSVSSGAPWISILSAANNTNDGTVSYSVLANPTATIRSGVVTIAGQSFTVTQAAAPCSFLLSSNSATHGSGIQIGSVTVTASLSGCVWSVSSGAPWISILTPVNNTNSGNVNYSVNANPEFIARTGVVSIAGQSFTVVQSGQPCTYTLSPMSASYGSAPAAGSVSITANSQCSWTVVNTNSWITITPPTSGLGNGTVNYNVATNAGGPRSGNVLIGNVALHVSQAGSISFIHALDMTITRGQTNRLYIALDSFGNENALGFSVCFDPNLLTFISAQRGADALSASQYIPNTNASQSAAGHVGVLIGLSPPQTFTAGSNSVWEILFRAAAGSSAATTTVSFCDIPVARGVVDGTDEVNELPASFGSATVVIERACASSLSASSASFAAVGGSGSVNVTTEAGCTWSVQNPNAWITITSATNGTVTFTVEANVTSIPRSGTITIAGQLFTVNQAGACIVTIAPANRAHGFISETGLVAVVSSNGCGWTVGNTNAWILITSSTNGSGSGNVTYTVDYNPDGLGRTGIVMIATNRFTISQTANPCPVTLSPANRSHGSGAEANSFTVTPASACAWTAVNTNSWISLPVTNGTGTATLNYSVAANPSSAPRTGVIQISGRSFVVTQAGACFYSITPTAALFGFGGGNGSVVLDTTASCSWTVQNTNAWVTFPSPSGTGGATLNYLVTSNTTIFARTGTVRIADQVLTITQSGIPCTFTLSATEQFLNSLPRTNSVDVTAAAANCNWTVSSTNSWITILFLTNYSGSATVFYSVPTNSSSLDRTGLVAVADQTLTIVQSSSPCIYTLSTNSLTLTSGNVTGLVSVTTTPGCSWVTVNTNSWISIKAGTNGTGSGLVRYTAAANDSPSLRSGNLLIGGQLHTVNQLGSPCSYTLSASGRLHGSLLETGQVSVLTVAECSWSVVNTNSWITFSATSGSGSLLISYMVQTNPASVDRVGVFVIGDQPYTVTQLGAECNYVLSTNSALHGGLSETGSVSVVAPMGCTWSVVEGTPWITILSGLTGTNSGTVVYSVALNLTGTNRTGVITIGGRPFTVTQPSVVCAFSVVPTNVLHGFEAEIGLISVTASNVCPWIIIETNTWITFPTGTNYFGSSNLSYSVPANPSATARTGVVMVAGQPVTIRQAGLVCSFSLAPASQFHEFRSATGQVAVASPTLCSWTVTKSNSWITILSTTNNVGSNTVRYAVSENPSITPRSGVITIAGQPFTVTQNGLPFIPPSNKVVLCGVPWDFDPPAEAFNCIGHGYYPIGYATVTNSGCGPTFVATRIWNATNACGVYMMATQTVSVITLPPVMSCAPNKTVECNSGWTFDAPIASDVCDGSTLPIRIVSNVMSTNGHCGNTFTVTRTWEATNSCGQVSSCSQTVHVVDTTPPVPNCAPAKTVECGSVWNFDAPTALDGCGGTNVTIRIFSTVTNATGSCGFTATRTWEIFDACTNRATCAQTVTAVDTTPPVLTCAPAKTVECGSVWNFNPPAATDNCSGTNVTIFVFSTVTNTSGSCGSSYTVTRTWEAMDSCGHMNFCSQTVRVVDTTPPTATCAANKTVEFGQAWTFDAPVGTDNCAGLNVTTRIVSTITNANCGSTFVATRTWEISDGCTNTFNCTQTVTVRDTTAPVITCAPSKAINCLAAWTFDPPTAIDVASGVSATVTVLNTVTNGTCGSGFTATRTWRATDSCGNSSTCSQTVSGRAIVTVSGTVYSPTNYPAVMTDKRVAGATLLGPTNAIATSAADGSYSSVFDAASNVVIRPLAPTGGNPVDGVSTLGISLVRLHILSVSNLNSPYKLLAADVDGDGTISALDLSFMRRLILGATNRFPSGLWRFVPANFAFQNVLSPWNAPTNRTYGGVASDLAGQDFVAVKLGDVNNAWAPPAGLAGFESAPAKDGSSMVSFEVNGATNVTGSSVVVKLAVRGFREVTSAQGTLSWNPAVIRFAGTEGHGLSGLAADNFGTNLTSTGKLVFSWDDPGARGVTLPDGTTIFTMRFDVIGPMGSISPVTLLDSIAAREVGVNFSAVTFRAVDGQVRVMEPPALKISQGMLTHGVYALTVPTEIGKRYILEYTDDLPATTWTALPPLIGDGKINILSDPAPAAHKRFYRLKVE